MGFSDTLRISASALTAERLRMDVISNNVANAHNTDPEQPYRRQRVVVRSQENTPFSSFMTRQAQRVSGFSNVVGTGVRVVRVEEDTRPGERVYEPNHPDADKNGYVTYPNVNLTTEMIDFLAATKAYQANVTVIEATKAMAMKALSIGSK